MANTRISQLLNIQRRYLRSAHLQRDFQDPSALDGYIVTPAIKANFDRIRRGMTPSSGQRAWRITGDYGSGKSSFALLLANLFAGRESDHISQIRRTLDLSKPKTRQAPFSPVLITGSREPLGRAVLQALFQALQLSFDKSTKPLVISQLRSALAKPALEVADTEALTLISEANSELIAAGKSSGLLIIIDELGKFLEFSALHPERQDVYFLQQLAELATRSGSEPIFSIGLLHQGFNAYAHQLSQSAQKEWEKVAGRFDELLFDQPLDQVTHLISAALNISENPRGTASRAREAMQNAASLGWFGLDAGVSALSEIAPTLYPLHPTVVPVLVRLFSRFGQNERSLFSFLLSNEPFGLQDFASQEVGPDTFYRIHHLYDYAAANFGQHLSIQTYRNHWNHIDSLIRSFPAKSDLETAILKTVGLLNLLNTPSLLANADAITLAVSDPGSHNDTVQKAIQRLHKERHVLYARGAIGGYFLWSHTSIDLDAAYEEAKRVVGTQYRVATRIKDRLESRPIVARRHYIQTGNLRHFDVVYCGIAELEKVANDPCANSDGRVVIPLCETLEEVNAATAFARSFTKRLDTLIGITQPLSSLSGLLQESERWTWIQKNTPELKDDRYAAEEVTRQVAHATQTLEKRVQHYAGLGQDLRPGESGITWYHRGKDREITSATNLLAYLSRLCKELYPDAPEIHNELINRRSPSSAANSARQRLIEGMLTSADKDFLGMDRSKKPPEMSMYRSLLLRSKLHRQVDGAWTLQAPAEEDPCNLKPGMSHILRMLEAKTDSQISVAAIFEELRKPPYGIRNGVLPILLLVVLLEHEHEIALYEDGTFLSQIHSEEIQRLTKAPKDFELQLCRVQGFRRELFDQVAGMLGQGETSCPKAQLLRVVRPLCVFVAELPEYTRTTTTEQLSKRAQQVRDTILRAKEPGTLLFTDLPNVLRDHDPASEPPSASQLVSRLKADLDELGKFYTQLRNRIRSKILKAFDAKASTPFQPFRDSLAERCQNLLLHIRDMELRAFCLRLLANHLPEPEWLESLASYVTNIPPARWRDQDESAFQEKLELLVNKLNRVESINIELGKLTTRATAFRISITARDGKDRDDLVHLEPSEEQQAKVLEQTLTSQLTKNSRVAKTALARVLWRLLPTKE